MPLGMSGAQSLSAGIGLGLNARQVHNQNQARQQQLEMKKQEDLRNRIAETFKTALATASQAADYASKIVADPKATPQQKEDAIRALGQTKLELFRSTEQTGRAAIQSGLISPDEHKLALEQLNVASQVKPLQSEANFNAQQKGMESYATSQGSLPADISKIQEQGKQSRMTKAVPSTQNINTQELQAPKGAQAGLFKELTTGEQSLDSMNQIQSLYEPDFLSYGGKAKGAAATVLNKMDPKQRSNFQQRRAAFISAANKEFIRFRKWATGVAGGPVEMAEIKRATFSEDDSPQDFESKLQLAKSLQRRLNARNKAALAAGVDSEEAFQKFIQQYPIDEFPDIQERGDQLERMGYSKDQVNEILVQEGYKTR